MLHRISSSALVAAFTLVVAHGQNANAQSVPFKASGSDAGFNPLSGHYEGQGTGTHLGKHDISGDLMFFSDPLPLEDGVFLSGTFIGTQTATAANGDKLKSFLSGSVVLYHSETPGLVEGTWYPEFVIDDEDSTGRFANATGTFGGEAINPPFDPSAGTPWPFDWYMTGRIDLGKKK
jgi:hypothetical protein